MHFVKSLFWCAVKRAGGLEMLFFSVLGENSGTWQLAAFFRAIRLVYSHAYSHSLARETPSSLA